MATRGRPGGAGRPDPKVWLVVLAWLTGVEDEPRNITTTPGTSSDRTTLLASKLVLLLKHEHWSVQSAAVRALGALGHNAAPFVDNIAELLQHEQWPVQAAALQALGALGHNAAPFVDNIAALLQHEQRYVQLLALQALVGALGDNAAPFVDNIAALLQHEQWRVQWLAVETLGALGNNAAPVANTIAQAICSYSEMGRAVVNSGPATPETLFELLRQAERSVECAPRARGFAYILAGQQVLGDSGVRMTELAYWLASNPEHRPTFPESLSHPEQVRLIDGFAVAWDQVKAPQKRVRRLVAERVAEIARMDGLGPDDLDRLETWHARLGQPGFASHRDSLQARIDAIKDRMAARKWAERIGLTLLIHALFWSALLLAYPRSPQVQAIFFWNPWVRRVTGMLYVGVLLAWVPPLRRRLFAPFATALLADAKLGTFQREHYFDRPSVKTPDGTRALIDDAIPALRGQVVLQGRSGLGKTMFVRHLLARSQRLSVFLYADRCRGGVMAAIQGKLQGPARDPVYLQKLVYSGTLDIYIDGLNEVDPHTRALIVTFVEENTHANIILTTQPLNWRPPATAQMYELLPLAGDTIEAFLLSRKDITSDDAPIRGQAFRDRCQAFLAAETVASGTGDSSTHARTDDEQQAMNAALSNPMDLTTVAQLLANDETPDLLQLQKQQYQVMDRAYRDEHAGQSFPLAHLAEKAYRMRLEDHPELPREGFDEALDYLARFKLAVGRQVADDGQVIQPGYFRHDKVHEFFIAQALLASDSPAKRLEAHLDDARFRGVYTLLAAEMAPADAHALRERMIEQVEDTNVAVVLHEFSQRLLARRDGAGAPQPTAALPATTDDLVLALEQCRALGARDKRQQLVARIPAEIGARIADHAVARDHFTDIVDTAAEFPDGLRQVRDAVLWFEGRTDAMNQVDRVCARLGVLSA